jgi:hypothetical protein
MNILIKLMSIVSLVIAPTLAQINAKKAPAPLPPSAGGIEKVKTINSAEPVAKINNSNTFQYEYLLLSS